MQCLRELSTGYYPYLDTDGRVDSFVFTGLEYVGVSGGGHLPEAPSWMRTAPFLPCVWLSVYEIAGLSGLLFTFAEKS